MRTRGRVLAVVIGAVLLAGTACTAERASPGPDRGGTVFPDEDVAGTVAELPQESLSPMPPSRLAEGLIPPTNRWFSGMVFGEVPEPVFPLPLAFSLTDMGFDFGVPPVQTGSETIAAGPSSDVSATFPTSVTPTVIGYDDASVTIRFADRAGHALGAVTIAEGSPIVAFTATTSTTITVAASPAQAGDDLFTTTVAGRGYGVTTSGTVTGRELRVEDGDVVTWFAVPTGTDPDVLSPYANGVTAVEGSYAASDQTASTTLAYRTAGGADTLMGVLPHQFSSLTAPAPGDCELGTYDTVYGTMRLCTGRELSWATPALPPSAALSLDALDALDDQTRDMIRAQLAVDVTTPSELPEDTYFGGKALYRLANLLQLAVQLEDSDSAEVARTRLADELVEWTTPGRCEAETSRCFIYDPAVKGLVGKVASFGSDEFNDHHFHYGYLLYAASVAVIDDPALMSQLRPVMDLVSAELATDAESSFFPRQRVFDAYKGHSWASGYVPFRDGNNQESSSEAVAAWNGLALWADTTDNAQLAEQARWMLSGEAASALAYWVGFDVSDPVYEGYQHSVVALNWGSKRDYSTWFSAEPNAKLGIQLIPMTPASNYLAVDSDRIADNLAEATTSGFDVQFGDYMLMYAALQNRAAAAAALEDTLRSPGQVIDDANSRSYLLAFLASHAQL